MSSLSFADDDEFFFSETKSAAEEKPYECLSVEDVAKQQDAAIQQLKPLLGDAVNPRILLNHYRYDAMRALNDWMEDADRVCKKAGLPPPDAVTTATTKSDDLTCSICFDTPEDTTNIPMLSCGHFFCIDCWQAYLSLEVKEKKSLITCPGRDPKGGKCNMVVDDDAIMTMLSEEEKAKYKDAMIQSFIDCNEALKWCPAGGCKYAVFVKEFSSEFKNESITCKCGHFFCFNCSQSVHQPASCSMVADWRKKTSGGDESIDQQLIATIARPCPKCSVPVEKNGGCNHMSCTRCQYHFCWLCMGKFGSGEKGGTDGYGNHKCNGYFQEDSDVLKKQEELKRFEFYNDRFNNHHKSMVLEQQRLNNSESFIQSMIGATGTSWISAQFYKTALEQLVANRKVLQNSYIFGYFRPLVCPYVNKLIFENLQLELERHTEKLANLIESNATPQAAFDAQQAVSHQVKIAASVSEALLNSANEWVELPATTEKGKPKKATKKRGRPASKNKSDKLTVRNLEKRNNKKAKTEKEKEKPKKKKVEEEEEDEEEESQEVEQEEDNEEDYDQDEIELQKAIQASLQGK